MKKQHLIPILFLAAFCTVSAQTNTPTTGYELPTHVEQISTNMVLASSDMDVDGRKVHLNLMYSHEIVTNAAEIQLVANDDDKKYIIWWSVNDPLQPPPSERQIATGDKKGIVGFCFNVGGSMLLFYEINAAKKLQEAKSSNRRVAPSAWINDWKGGGDLKQEIVRTKLPNMQKNCVNVDNLQMRQEKGQWVISIDAASTGPSHPKTKYYYQYPVGGTGLTFLKKEPVPGVPEDVVKCMRTMGMIINSKRAWAGVNDKYPGDEVDTNQLFSIFLKGAVVKCPDGGVYDVGAVGEMPKCSIHGVYKQ